MFHKIEAKYLDAFARLTRSNDDKWQDYGVSVVVGGYYCLVNTIDAHRDKYGVLLFTIEALVRINRAGKIPKDDDLAKFYTFTQTDVPQAIVELYIQNLPNHDPEVLIKEFNELLMSVDVSSGSPDALD